MKQFKLISLTMFDLLKGCCMIMVIMLHSIWGIGVDKLSARPFYAILMPVFFITSGYWMKKRKIADGIKSACRYLLKPYVIVMVIIVAIGGVHRALTHNMDNWFDQFLIPALLVDSDGTRIGPMWFVFCLFLCWCLFYAVVNLIKEERAQIAFAAALCTLGGLVLPQRLPFQIGQTMLAFALFYFGYWLKRHRILEKKLGVPAIILLLTAWALSVYFGAVDFSVYEVKYGIFSIAGSACGSFLVIYASLRLNRVECAAFDCVRAVGRYTMWILCIHSFEKAIVPWEIPLSYIGRDSLQGIIAWFVMRSVFIYAVCRAMLLVQRKMAERAAAGQ